MWARHLSLNSAFHMERNLIKDVPHVLGGRDIKAPILVFYNMIRRSVSLGTAIRKAWRLPDTSTRHTAHHRILSQLE
jgi:hypothetical protein